ERVDRIHAVATEAPTIAALKDLHVDPLAPGLCPGEGNHFQVTDTSRNVLRHGLAERLHHRVGELVAWAEARNRRGWKLRVREAPFGRDDLDGTSQPVIHRNVTVH